MQILRRLVYYGILMAGLTFFLVTGIARAQQNVTPPLLKTVPEEGTSKDPYHKSESGDQPSARPQKPPPKDEGPSVEEWRGEAQKLLDTLGKLLKSIPTYEAPTVDEKGDIIIRRRPPASNDPKPASPPQGDGKTLGT